MSLRSVGGRLTTIGAKPLKMNYVAVSDSIQLVNWSPPFSAWQFDGGAVIDGDGVVTLPTVGARVSCLMRNDYASQWTFSTEVFSEAMSPNPANHPYASRLYGSTHYAGDGVTQVPNSSGYHGNGNAATFVTSTWRRNPTSPDRMNGLWTNSGGPLVKFVRINISCDGVYAAPGNKYRLPVFAQFNGTPDYSHYFLKGIG